MTETTVRADLLQALQVITELGVDTVGEDLGVLAVDNVALTVEEPLYHCQTNSLLYLVAGRNVRLGSCRRWGSG